MSPKPSKQRTSALNVRIRAEEMEYLTEQAERLEVTLSEMVRAAIARSYLTDAEAGRTTVDSWIHPYDATLLDVEAHQDSTETTAG